MGLTSSLALLRVHVLVVELPGRPLLGLRAEAAVRARGWVVTSDPEDADLGIAMGGGTDAAGAAADLVLVRDDPALVATAVRLARGTLRTIRGNLFWAFAYNAAALPVAMLGLLNPIVAGGAMAVSSVLVVGNSLRLARFRA